MIVKHNYNCVHGNPEKKTKNSGQGTKWANRQG